ncbi:B12-binding domain-containing radical SAM protein [Aestuariicoccus sp. MJ-SS9]|uniref:B12-binding domain-containing radical SAM protein n=1 Tax=Aestuariicoccus sp. MJ-SS9 TaxID=3079855 RepID=UPI00290B19D3|nr:radical SAM protein [Aestuariicoccus sp. MJ-SS9]MDU8909794.1 DUF4070 domain-containing protein [Aestuariicoccus sp. MJ-SS9]
MKPLRICLINPRVPASYWGMEHAVSVMSRTRQSYMVPGALPALAALVPEEHEVVLLDENVEEIEIAALSRFDVIGVTGMIVQRERMFELLGLLRDLPARVILGGPYVTVEEQRFEGLCDTRFIGEADTTWPAYLDDLAHGRPVAERYEQANRTDMEAVPAPRYDALRRGGYRVASLQFSRGCPFLCEFCDIITIFGRKPRTKRPEQMLREVEAIRAAGFDTCFLVDDNFIGNKKKDREFLLALKAWQEANGYPIGFTTEASINLADDPEFIGLMVDVGFREVFIGIESPRPESLAETRKVQNTRGGDLGDKVRIVRDHGLTVQAGFIVGFDNDDARIFDEQFRFIQDTGIAKAAIALLTPIPSTPLYDRLKAEGRLDLSNDLLIFAPRQMDRGTLLKGYRALLHRLYDPETYFARLLDGYAASPGFRQRRGALNRKITATRQRAGLPALAAAGPAMRFARALLPTVQGRALMAAYWRAWRRNRALPGGIAIPFASFLGLCIEHRHFYLMAHTDDTNYIGQSRTRAAAPALAQTG